jgi:PAS domain S-box-containing protein
MKEIYEVLNGAADGAFVVDEQLRIQFWNRATEEITGFCKGDVIGQKCYQILQGRDEKRRLICKAYCHVAELALKSEPVSISTTLLADSLISLHPSFLTNSTPSPHSPPVSSGR